MRNKFTKVFDNDRYGQIVMMRKQDDQGAPEIRFFFHPEGFGVCSFAIGYDAEDPKCWDKTDATFNNLVPQEIIQIVDGFVKHMESEKTGMH
jgi:hypothetical protein